MSVASYASTKLSASGRYHARIFEKAMLERHANKSSIIFIDQQGSIHEQSGPSRFNHRHADIVINEIRYMTAKGLLATNISILTFYKAQAKLYEKKLRKLELDEVEVLTVDSAQGHEKSIVIIDAVVSTSIDSSEYLDDYSFALDPFPDNCALSRARNGLIYVFDSKTMEGAGSFCGRMPQLARDRKIVVPPK